ncbi:hypothetical protein H0H93_005703 [Arthromyces matolae]|nr:hypothetical protein H0H93_005703 [Arthromyces matolae]
MTTLPPRSFEQTAVIGANGFAECLFQGGKQKRSILSIPGFPHSVPNFSPPRYRIGPSEHGQGMFATSKIEAGALIFAERPVLVTPRPIPIEISYPEGISQAEMIKIQLTEYEKVLEMCVDRMLPQDRKAFFELCDNHIEDGSGPILGRLRTNGFAIQIEEDKRSELHAGTFIAASRINHSCVPNVSRRFDRPSFSLQFYAVRAIEAGDELFVNYSGTTIPRSQRQTKLLPYGFQCTCPACSDPNFDVRLAWLMRSYETVCSRPFGLDNPQAALDESLFAIKEIEALGLESQIGYFEHLARGAAMAGMVGKMELSKRLSEKVEKMQMFATGKKFVDIAEAEFKQLQDQARETGGWVFKRF